MAQYTRRRIIATTLATAGGASLAGCTSDTDTEETETSGNSSGDGDERTAQSTFFVFGDFADKVAGDTATAETLVPIGSHGHGWEPGPQVQGDVLESDLFIYVNEGFQPWADDLVTSLHDDDADVEIVEAGRGIELLESDHDHDHDHGHDDHGHEDDDHGHEDDHDDHHDDEIGEFVLIDRDSNEAVADVHGDHWHGELPHVHHGEHLSLGATIEDEDGHEYHLGEDEEYQFRARVADGADDHVVEFEFHGDHLHLAGAEHGTTEIVFQLYHDDHADYESPPLTLEVTDENGEHEHGEDEHEHDDDHDHEDDHDDHEHEDDHDDHEHDDGHGHDHDHADGKDPHFWLDPVRAKQAVSNIRSGFVDVDGDNASIYAENAEEYRDRLDELHENFQSTLENASNDVVLLAGHDAFKYLGERYDFEIETLTGLTPDEQPTPRDIERAQNVIEEHDLDYVCADPLESQAAAEQLVEETGAEEVLPLTPAPGKIEEWDDNDWGYVEIMENINLETLTKALDAE